MGMLRSNSSEGAWRPTRGKLLGICQIYLVMPSSMDSTFTRAEWDMPIMQQMWFILECAPYSKRRCLMCEDRGAMFTALQISSNYCLVQRRWASGQREDVRAVPRYPPGGARLVIGNLTGAPLSRRGRDVRASRRLCSLFCGWIEVPVSKR